MEIKKSTEYFSGRGGVRFEKRTTFLNFFFGYGEIVSYATWRRSRGFAIVAVDEWIRFSVTGLKY